METQTVETNELEQRQHEGQGDPNARPVVFVTVIGIIVLLITVFGLQGLYYQSEQREAQRKLLTPEYIDLQRMRAEQRANLAGYRWADREKHVVTIPIERAMQQVIQEHGRSAPAGR
jgi:hypothetical protein